MRLGDPGLGDMGLGDLCIFSAVAHGLHKQTGKKVVPYRPVRRLYQRILLNIKGKKTRWVNRDLYHDNPAFYQGEQDDHLPKMYVPLPDRIYFGHELDSEDKTRHIYVKPYEHYLVRMCRYYGVHNPEVRCHLVFTEQEQQQIADLVKNLDNDFVTIEPHSQIHNIPNRAYPFTKWQKVVNALKDNIQVVQIGAPGTEVLQNVVDLTGKTSFKIAAGIGGQSRLFLSVDNGLTHAITATDTIGLIIHTGYQPVEHYGYPHNMNISVAKHGPCGLIGRCPLCEKDGEEHDENEIVQAVIEYLNL